MKKITYEKYLDKIRGGWIGKCAGGILGAPIEGFKCFHNIQLSEKLFVTNYPNDDLDLQVLWLDLVKQKGPWIDENDLGQFWHEHVDFPWGEYGLAARNLRCGQRPPLSGKHNNDYWNRGMGSPIRSEIWGMLCAGNPEKAAYYAKMDSSLDHVGFSVEAEMFLSACEALAFFESDIQNLLKKAVSIFPSKSEITNMYNKVVEFNSNSDYDTAKGKIKSYFGDADFTSSPMNVAFAVHALLNFPVVMESVMEAVNLGHDSDCISATVGALLGTIIGYKNIDPKWKKFIGDELLVSPQIQGINYASTISELAVQTASAGLSFGKLLGIFEAENVSIPVKTDYKRKNIGVIQEDLEKWGNTFKLAFELRNYTETVKTVSVHLESEILNFSAKQEILIPGNKKKKITFTAEARKLLNQPSYFPYKIVLKAENEMLSYDFGIPNYGEWLMIGPFIEDDKNAIPMHPVYPDHGLASLPSIPYMNHDLLATGKTFVSHQQIQDILKKRNFNALPFLVKQLQPPANQLELEKQFVGRGERTIYLVTKIITKNACQKWLCYAGRAFITLWVNGKEIAKSTVIKRSWPMAYGELIDLNEGENILTFRLDCPIDSIKFQAGLKDFQGEHFHQSQWETELIPTIN
jgi:ADP-ribosylglycohydrolase